MQIFYREFFAETCSQKSCYGGRASCPLKFFNISFARHEVGEHHGASSRKNFIASLPEVGKSMHFLSLSYIIRVDLTG